MRKFFLYTDAIHGIKVRAVNKQQALRLINGVCDDRGLKHINKSYIDKLPSTVKEPKTLKAKFQLLLNLCKMTADGLGKDEEDNRLFNDVIAMIQNELGNNNTILEKYGLIWEG